MPAPTAGRPGRPRSAAIDAAILEATVEELIERGYLGLSIESIAARAGVAKTTLYRRWATTEELALAAMRRLQGPRPAPAADAPVREVLLSLLDGMRRTWDEPRYAALMRRVAADGTAQPEVYRDVRARLVGPQLRAMNRALRRARDEGVIRPGTELRWVRQLLCAPVLAAALTHTGRLSRAQLEFVLDTVLAGLAS